MTFDFTHCNYVVTGASSGMGKQVAIELAETGAKVLAIARGKAALEALKALYPENIEIGMDGLTVMDFALHDVTELIKKLLVRMNWTKDEIDSLVLHQANRMIVNYVAKKVKVDKSKVMLSVEDTGNTGSCSIPLALCKELASHNEATKLSKVVMCAFGTGLSAVAAGLNLQGTYFGVVEDF